LNQSWFDTYEERVDGNVMIDNDNSYKIVMNISILTCKTV